MSGFFEPRSAFFHDTSANCAEWWHISEYGTPKWSAIKLRIVSHTDIDRVQGAVNELLADEAISVVGISPAIPGVQGDEFGCRYPEHVVTVLYQERLP